MRAAPKVAWLAVPVTVAAVAAALIGAPADASSRPSASTTDAASTSYTGGQIVIDDITITVPGGHEIPAYVVRPAGRQKPKSLAGVLFLHWLGELHSDRSEFLAEAIKLARNGVVSVMPQGSFPWKSAPIGDERDVEAVKTQLGESRAALDLLAGLRSVDPNRIALVGHDYGAMYGALLADSDSRVSALVLETPDARWGNWFAKYWLQYHGDERAAYLKLFRDLDPVHHTARLGESVLFQWAGRDIYVSEKVRDQYAASSPDAKVKLYPTAEHHLTDQAQVERDAFLEAQLGLGG